MPQANNRKLYEYEGNIRRRCAFDSYFPPPYFNAPFDYEGLFKNYDQYLGVLKKVANESFRVLQKGRIFVLNIDDMLINGEKFPIVADATRIFLMQDSDTGIE